MRYVFPAIFHKSEDGGYWLEFPDVKGAVTQGDTMYEAIMMAEDVLSMALVCAEDEGREIPVPSLHTDIATEKDDFIEFIKADTDVYRETLKKAEADKPKKVA